MLIEASRTLSLEPSTSLHSTGTYQMWMPNRLERQKSSMSKAHFQMCRTWNSCLADCLVKYLNPHWVSLARTPQTPLLMTRNTAETNRRCSFLYTFVSSENMALDPTIMINGWSSLVSRSCIFCWNFPREEKSVAPSASTMRMYCPLAKAIPALTAPPLPLFLGYSTTQKCQIASYRAVLKATYAVLSLEPSLTMMTSQSDCFCELRQPTVSASMTGSLSSSLQLGTTRLSFGQF